jgi:hypothetical protein
VDQGSALLYTSKDGRDPGYNGDYQISIEYNGIIELEECSETASILLNKDTAKPLLQGQGIFR